MCSSTKLVITATIFAFFITICSSNNATEKQFEQQSVASHHRCKYDEDCKNRTFCYGNDDNLQGICKCKDGYDIFRNGTDYDCYKTAKYDEPCEFDYYCTEKLGNFGICNQKTKVCACNDSVSHVYDGFCYESRKISQTCLNDKQCKLANGEFRYCADGFCACKLNERPLPDLNSCQISKKIGENCTQDEECQLIPHAICRETCQCVLDYVISRNNSECYKVATDFGESCIENDQCTKALQHSACNNGKCTCKNGYHQIDNIRCLRDTVTGERCTLTEDCINDPNLKGHVECNEGVCKCLNGLDDKGQCKTPNTAANLLYNTLIANVLAMILFLLIN